ncbi:MAG: hypothetical protein R3A10_15370 [Caldilineaceae bacterium]
MAYDVPKSPNSSQPDLELALLRRLPFSSWLERFDIWLTALLARYGITAMRVGLGIIFFWFGALKLVPGLSPAEDLVRNTIYFINPDIFLPILAVWEMAIGLGLLTGKFMRLTLLLLFLQMPGTALPLVLLPEVCYTRFPFGLTLEGQYIIKNLVLITAGMVIGSTVLANVVAPEASAGTARCHHFRKGPHVLRQPSRV